MIKLSLKNNKYANLLVHKPYENVNINTVLESDVVSLLIVSYSGIKGELTATIQYSYQSFYSKLKNEDLHEIIEEISITEMHHLEILSQILLSQKKDPKFCRYVDINPDICEPWSANNINYEKDIAKFLEYNIRLEQSAIETYNRIIESTDSVELRSIINRIIEDEKAHLKVFNDILSSQDF